MLRNAPPASARRRTWSRVSRLVHSGFSSRRETTNVASGANVELDLLARHRASLAPLDDRPSRRRRRSARRTASRRPRRRARRSRRSASCRSSAADVQLLRADAHRDRARVRRSATPGATRSIVPSVEPDGLGAFDGARRAGSRRRGSSRRTPLPGARRAPPGVPSCSMWPPFMTTMKSAIVIASSWSCVTWTNVIPISCWMLLSSSCISLRSLRSSAPSGSSSSSTRGMLTSARASATRCCWPPESCRGLRPP